jgi:hypothetical protein
MYYGSKGSYLFFLHSAKDAVMQQHNDKTLQTHSGAAHCRLKRGTPPFERGHLRDPGIAPVL